MWEGGVDLRDHEQQLVLVWLQADARPGIRHAVQRDFPAGTHLNALAHQASFGSVARPGRPTGCLTAAQHGTTLLSMAGNS